MKTDEIFVLLLIAMCIAVIAISASYSRRRHKRAADTEMPEQQ
jgi:hypothetical protein